MAKPDKEALEIIQGINENKEKKESPPTEKELEQLVSSDLPSRVDVLNPRKKEAIDMIIKGVKILADLNDDPNESEEAPSTQEKKKDTRKNRHERIQKQVDIITGGRG